MARFDVVSQGEELVSGSTVDTNAGWIAREMKDRGFEPGRFTVVGDVRDHIRDVLREAAARAEVVVCTGGLGPTTDDLTAEAAAEAFGLELALDEAALAQVEARYASRGRAMPPANRKQAVLPVGCRVLENHWGTAPAFRVEHAGSVLYFLPGVPSEMKAIWARHVAPDLDARFSLPPRRTVLLRCVGLPESEAQGRMDGFAHPGVEVGYRAHLPEIHVKLHLAPDADGEAALADARARLGRYVFTVDGGPLAQVVGEHLAARGETLATAESCTAGRIAAMITAIPGSSGWYTGGAVVYANAEKTRQCGVDPDVLAREGAVSEPVARALAEGIRARTGASWGIGVTGIAGPGGGSAEKPVGTVHVAVAGPDGTHHRLLRLPFDRERVMSMSAALALDQLRRRLDGTAD